MVLKGLVTDVRNLRKNSQIHQTEMYDHQAPEFYVAMPEKDLASLQHVARTGTGTDSVDGPGEHDKPGHGICDIYQLRKSDGAMQKIAIHQDVYNLSASTIAKATWIQVTRDKFGTWWALTPGSGSNPRIMFQLLQVNCVSFTARAIVLYRSKGASYPDKMSIVKVCDPSRRFFIGASAALVGSIGFAEEFDFDCDTTSTGTSTSSTEEDTGTGTGTSDEASETSWIVYSLPASDLSC